MSLPQSHKRERGIVPRDWIHQITVRRTASTEHITVIAETAVTVTGSALRSVTSSGQRVPADSDGDHLREIEDAQLSELRKQLYAAGFSKRAISMAIKDAKRTIEHEA
jgi:hypothetical protein